MIIVVWFVSFAVFILVRLSGDPASIMLPFEASAEDRQALRDSMGLNRPVAIQYGVFLAHLIRGDLGISARYRLPVFSLIRDRLSPTVILTLCGMGLAVLLGIALGALQATYQGTLIDLIGTVLSVLAFSMPGFWLGLVLIMLFAVHMQWLPSSGMGTWKHLVLPSLTLAAAFLAYVSLLVRNGMIETLSQDYIRTAKAKGLRQRTVVFRHALRNALIPVVSVTALNTGTLLGGAVITESVFQWPGIGLLALQSISFRDFPVVQGVVIILALGVVLMNFVGDLLYVLIDPRLRYE
jgi:peptide/nickel transport system permease protein